MKFRASLGLPPEGIRTPRSPRDDERDPASWREQSATGEFTTSDISGLAPYSDIVTREILYASLP